MSTDSRSMNKKRKAETALVEIETRLASQSGKFEEYQSVANTWRNIFKAVTGIENHGSKKEEGQSWKSFFEHVGGNQLTEYPAIFNSSDMGFDEMLMVLTSHVRQLELKLVSTTKRKLAAETALQKKNRAVENQKKRDEQKVEEFFNTELQQEKANASKILCLCFGFTLTKHQAFSGGGDQLYHWCFVSVSFAFVIKFEP